MGESITSYNGLVQLYYQGEIDRPSLPARRKKGGLAACTFSRQAKTFEDGYFKPSISRETKPKLIAEIKLELPEFIEYEYDLFRDLKKTFRTKLRSVSLDHGATSALVSPFFKAGRCQN